MNKVFIGLGTNLGNRMANIELAYIEIENQIGTIEKKSSFYKTPPWGYDSTKDFFNTIVQVSTNLPVNELLIVIKKIEGDLGRAKKKKNSVYEDRLIDLDIIDFNGQIFDLENLTVPHERMHLRSFVLFPLEELAPNWVHPITQKPIKSLISENLKDAIIERIL